MSLHGISQNRLEEKVRGAGHLTFLSNGVFEKEAKESRKRDHSVYMNQHGVMQQIAGDLLVQDAYKREQKIPLLQLQVRDLM